MKKAPKKIKNEFVITSYKAGTYLVEVFAYHYKNAKNQTTFKSMAGFRFRGLFNYACRITAKNGNIIHDQQGFDTPQNARKNLQAIKKVAPSI